MRLVLAVKPIDEVRAKAPRPSRDVARGCVVPGARMLECAGTTEACPRHILRLAGKHDIGRASRDVEWSPW